MKEGQRKTYRLVHYVNQFFGGLGGEDKAHAPLDHFEEVVGPGRALEQSLGDQGSVVATIVCGDNYHAENRERVSGEVVKLLKHYKADAFLAGPAFNAGRYGMACGELCKTATEKLGIPAVTAMFEENPGVDVYHTDVIIVRSGDSARRMSNVADTMVGLVLRLCRGEKIGLPNEEGYFPRGIIRNEQVEKNAAERAVDMVLSKIRGEKVTPEIELPRFDRIVPAVLAYPLSEVTLALATDGGLVPLGNPDNLVSNRSTRFACYSIRGLHHLSADQFEANHMGFDTSLVNRDPNRLVPLDAARHYEKAGRIGKLADDVFTTAGVATSLKNAEYIGRGMAEAMKVRGIEAAILTST